VLRSSLDGEPVIGSLMRLEIPSSPYR
jgi:hypothetical protein